MSETYTITSHAGERIECEPVFIGHCSVTFDKPRITTACEGGLFRGADGDDIVAVCILGRWLDTRHVGLAFAWTTDRAQELPAEVAERIEAAA